MAIYTLTGRDIYQKRQSLREFSALSHIEEGKLSAPNSRTTDVQITSQAVLKFPQSLHHARGMRNLQSSNPPPDSQEHQPYTINIESPKPSRGSPSSSSYNTDIAAWAYTKVAMLFFAALLITWVSSPFPIFPFPSPRAPPCRRKQSKPPPSQVPATVNRVYTFVHAGDLNFPLMYIEALVLPLQGFWNAVIYIATSMAACRGLWRTLSRQRRRRPPGSVLTAPETKSRHYIAVPETTSMTEAVGRIERAGGAR
ncbi:MAG: hypothetical protein LQ347_002491 [Umbilicaria vellea]|nr:MAG: hypothetical protein LQ347_002491 [Umbilicaria vellea]